MVLNGVEESPTKRRRRGTAEMNKAKECPAHTAPSAPSAPPEAPPGKLLPFSHSISCD